jgi:ureidoglycolate hydrolase
MDNQCLDILDYDGHGYQPMVDFEGWRVALLRYSEESHPENDGMLERHTETDEIFVLLEGKAVMIMGGNAAQVDGIALLVMEKGKIYNVRRNAWHSVVLSKDANVLIVENQDTSEANSEYVYLPEERRGEIVTAARREGILYGG